MKTRAIKNDCIGPYQFNFKNTRMNIKSAVLLMGIFEAYINADQSENDLNYLKTNADKLDVWKHSDHFPFQRFRVPKQDQ